MLNAILTLPTDQTFHQFQNLDTELDLHGITSGFHGAPNENLQQYNIVYYTLYCTIVNFTLLKKT